MLGLSKGPTASHIIKIPENRYVDYQIPYESKRFGIALNFS